MGIKFGTVDNAKLICDFISIDITHPEAQRSTLARHAGLLLYFSWLHGHEMGFKWFVSNSSTGMQTGGRSRQGSPILFV